MDGTTYGLTVLSPILPDTRSSSPKNCRDRSLARLNQISAAERKTFRLRLNLSRNFISMFTVGMIGFHGGVGMETCTVSQK